MISRDILNRLKERYPVGTQVELIHMNDPYVSMPSGLKGTVSAIDDTGTIFVNWENRSYLGVVYGEDSIRKI